MPQTASVYLHIPFCLSKCAYCDFPSFAGIEGMMEPYAAAIVREIRSTPRLSAPTVYIGGGTPSYFPARLMDGILKATAGHFRLEEGAEFTIEANPGTATEEKLRLWRQNGVNRLSIGVQSFNDRLLKTIGRGHTAADAKNTVAAARAAGFKNISIDLMYGLPGQTVGDLQNDIQSLLSLRPEHASVYQLILEEGTRLKKMVDEGEVFLPDEDETVRMGDAATEALATAGYRHYEISNYSLPGRECRHNTACWLGKPFLGLGSGAHSFINAKRLANPKNVQEYIRLMESAGSASTEIPTDEKARFSDYFIMRLRLINNDVSYKEVSDALSVNFQERFKKQLLKLEAEGYITRTGSSFHVSNKGIRYLDSVILELSKV